jgi:hypothetical protein
LCRHGYRERAVGKQSCIGSQETLRARRVWKGPQKTSLEDSEAVCRGMEAL